MATTIDAPRLLNLPAELRVRIYQFICDLSTSGPITISARRIGFMLSFCPAPQFLFPDLDTVENIESRLEVHHRLRRHSSHRKRGIRYHFVCHDAPEADFKELINFAKVCRTTRAEIMGPLIDRLFFDASDVSLACWFGITNPFLAPLLTHLEIKNPISGAPKQRERWLKQIFTYFPSLRCLNVTGIHQHKDPYIWGSGFRKDDLEMMKMVCENTGMQHIVSQAPGGYGDVCWVRDCNPRIQFMSRVSQRSS